MKIVHLVVSDNVFGGFEHYLQMTPAITTENDVITAIISKLRDVLHFNKMNLAIELLQQKQFHIHARSIEDIINSEETIYVCCH